MQRKLETQLTPRNEHPAEIHRNNETSHDHAAPADDASVRQPYTKRAALYFSSQVLQGYGTNLVWSPRAGGGRRLEL